MRFGGQSPVHEALLSTGTIKRKSGRKWPGSGGVGGWGGAVFPTVNRGNPVGPRYIVDST